MEENIELLRNVNKVETPAFLYTRIEAKISNMEESAIGFSKWSLASLVLVVCLNFAVGYSYVNSGAVNQSNQVNPYQQITNQYYYE
jgi:hypothetical protein